MYSVFLFVMSVLLCYSVGMKLVITSDLHGSLPDIPECDLLIIAGDSCPVDRSHNPVDQSVWLGGTFKHWLREQPAHHKVFIGGNHDFAMDSRWFYAPKDLGAHYLCDSGVTMDGVSIYGFPWVGNLPNWAFHKSDADLRDAVRGIPECDILVAHAPPSGILDEVMQKSYPHVGTPEMMANVTSRIKPALYVCGHIHESYGIEEVGETLYANVAHMDRSYDPINPLIQIDFDEVNKTVKSWESGTSDKGENET